MCTNNEFERVRTLGFPIEYDNEDKNHKKEVMNDVGDGDDYHANLKNDFVLNPIYVIKEWEKKEEDRRVSLVILMPSGICERSGDYEAQVAGSVEASVVWPRCMRDMLYLHQMLVDHEPSFAEDVRIAGFRSFLRCFRSTSTEEIVSSCRIKLLFPAKSEISFVKRN